MLCWDLACQVEDMIINAKSPHRQQKRRLGTEKPNSKGHCFGWLHQVSFVGFMSWIAAKLRRLQQAPTSQSRPGSDSGTEWKMSPFQATVREKAQVGFAQLEPFQSKGGGRCRKEGWQNGGTAVSWDGRHLCYTRPASNRCCGLKLISTLQQQGGWAWIAMHSLQALVGFFVPVQFACRAQMEVCMV